jgi:transcriptional regulator with XRE-family HTH domain
MENEKLAQRVKELRKLNGLSQEELAKNSGLSLRTIQRVENGETEPTGETLKRISSALDVTPNELIGKDGNKEEPKKTVKTKYEYLHIFDNKLVISKTPELNDLVEDYGKSVNNVFKTLMVFFIGIPIFTALTVIFYNLGKTELAIYAGSVAFFFLVVAFYTILFTSGTSIIKREIISKIVIKKALHYTSVVISYRESGRLKERGLLLEKDQIDTMKDSLLSEKLIEENNIKLKTNMFSLQNIILALTMIIPFFGMFFKKIDQTMFYYGAIVIFVSVSLIIKMMLRSIRPLGQKTTN